MCHFSHTPPPALPTRAALGASASFSSLFSWRPPVPSQRCFLPGPLLSHSLSFCLSFFTDREQERHFQGYTQPHRNRPWQGYWSMFTTCREVPPPLREKPQPLWKPSLHRPAWVGDLRGEGARMSWLSSHVLNPFCGKGKIHSLP